MKMQSTLFEDSSNSTYNIEIQTPEISESFMQSKLTIEMILNIENCRIESMAKDQRKKAYIWFREAQ